MVQVRAPLAPTPQGRRVQATNHDPAVGHQHPLDLSQRGMGIGREFQRVRQHDQVQAAGRKRQSRKISDKSRARHGGLCCQPAVRHAVGGQPFNLGQTQLQGVKSKHIGHGQIELGTLPRQQVTPRGRREPVMQTYNLIAHEVNPTTRLCR